MLKWPLLVAHSPLNEHESLDTGAWAWLRSIRTTHVLCASACAQCARRGRRSDTRCSNGASTPSAACSSACAQTCSGWSAKRPRSFPPTINSPLYPSASCILLFLTSTPSTTQYILTRTIVRVIGFYCLLISASSSPTLNTQHTFVSARSRYEHY